jgi:hypothetical protein
LPREDRYGTSIPIPYDQIEFAVMIDVRRR